MKKLLVLLVLFVFTCSGDGDSSNFNNISDDQYFFEIEFAGEIHKVQGNTSDMLQNGQNICLASLSQGIQTISFRLDDISAEDYVSGQPIWIGLGISNPQIGNNQRGALAFLTTAYTQEIEQQFNIRLQNGYFIENSPGDLIDVLSNNIDNIISDINITDLGLPPTPFSVGDDPLNFSPYGNPIRGSYEGILYFNDTSDDFIEDGDSGRDLVIPMPIRISFSAPRSN